ncbi:hypothetical protein H072_9044 [Dactylellina haptotyla CBS 200.50]|uniref:Uncharacterized protein n=1 Tax=Dactylellina haptotyla (strain CBS 200.50) TaxID=1284197 RepID=S8A2K1_DACHA|nr:hypothetical protein H072_9044 [Dactylellina haptotyla CBS 200.50]
MSSSYFLTSFNEPAHTLPSWAVPRAAKVGRHIDGTPAHNYEPNAPRPAGLPPPPENRFLKIMCSDHLADLVLKHLESPRDRFMLLNVNRKIRSNLLNNCFGCYRRVIITRLGYPSHWRDEDVTHTPLESETLKKVMQQSGKWPSRKYFDRFTDFSFEELIVSKLMRIPYWLDPAADEAYLLKMNTMGINLRTLVLDGTAVTGRGLFGSVSMPTNNNIYRSSPGLISHVAFRLEHLSVRYCPNIQHSDILIYLLMPPQQSSSLFCLQSLRAFGCGEAPVDGPFHNKPGYGSRNKLTQKSDNILNIQILALLFPTCLTKNFHSKYSVPLTLGLTNQRSLEDQRLLLDELFYSKWLSPETLLMWPPPLTLPDSRTGKEIPGPFGGFIGAMHETLMLKAYLKGHSVRFDFTFCVMGDQCTTVLSSTFAPMARVNKRSGRTTMIGNLHGSVIGGEIRKQDYHHFVNGVIPRVPVALSTLIPGKADMYLPIPLQFSNVASKKDEKKWKHMPKLHPKYQSLQGDIAGPDYDDPYATGEVYQMTMGLSGEGPHNYVAVAQGRRRAQDTSIPGDTKSESYVMLAYPNLRVETVEIKKFFEDHKVRMRPDKYDCITCQNCFEQQLKFAKTELERCEVWKWVGVNIGLREMRAVKLAQAQAWEARYFKPKTSPVPDIEMVDVPGASEIKNRITEVGYYDIDEDDEEDPNASQDQKDDQEQQDDQEQKDDQDDNCSDTSIDSTDPEQSGENHPILKTMDKLYSLLCKDLCKGGVVVHGVTELLKTIRQSQQHMKQCKVYDASLREIREAWEVKAPDAVPHKRRKTENSVDPRVNYNTDEFQPKIQPPGWTDNGMAPKKFLGAGTPLLRSLPGPRNEYGRHKIMEPDFYWAPTEPDRDWFEHKLNQIDSDWYVADEDLWKMDIPYTGFKKEDTDQYNWEPGYKKARAKGEYSETYWYAKKRDPIPKGEGLGQGNGLVQKRGVEELEADSEAEYESGEETDEETEVFRQMGLTKSKAMKILGSMDSEKQQAMNATIQRLAEEIREANGGAKADIKGRKIAAIGTNRSRSNAALDALRPEIWAIDLKTWKGFKWGAELKPEGGGSWPPQKEEALTPQEMEERERRKALLSKKRVPASKVRYGALAPVASGPGKRPYNPRLPREISRPQDEEVDEGVRCYDH